MRFFLIPAVVILLFACRAPKPKYLTRDGGMWNIEEMHYSRTGGPDSLFSNCGEMHFEMEQDESKKEDDWDVEGYLTAPEEVQQNGTPTFIWSTFWFRAQARTGLEIENDISWFNFTLQEWKVTKREKNYMEWSWTNWDGDVNVSYKLRRK